MLADELIERFYRDGKSLPEGTCVVVQHDAPLRFDLVKRFTHSPDRSFALALLEAMIERRRRDDDEDGCPSEDLMFASYLVGMAGHVEDSLRIWEAKEVDFDTHCLVDVKLIVFKGVEETLSYLAEQTNPAAAKARAYIELCKESGDFENIKHYFARDSLPWWIGGE